MENLSLHFSSMATLNDAHEARKLDHLIWLMEVAIYKMEAGAEVSMMSWSNGVEIKPEPESLPPLLPLVSNQLTGDLHELGESIFQMGLRR
jgi:hypothetical protein